MQEKSFFRYISFFDQPVLDCLRPSVRQPDQIVFLAGKVLRQQFFHIRNRHGFAESDPVFRFVEIFTTIQTLQQIRVFLITDCHLLTADILPRPARFHLPDFFHHHFLAQTGTVSIRIGLPRNFQP